MKAQLTFELLMNVLLGIAVIALLSQGLASLQQGASSHAYTAALLTKTNSIAQEFNCYVNGAYLTDTEKFHYAGDNLGCVNDAGPKPLVVVNTVCYKLVNNSIVAEYQEGNKTKRVNVHTLVYKAGGGEPV